MFRSRALGTLQRERVALHCGWGRLLFGQTFEDSKDLACALRSERDGERDIAMYVREPHVVLACAPQELFLDPSHTFRMQLSRYRHRPPCTAGYRVRPLASLEDAAQVVSIYHKRRMVPVNPRTLLAARGGGPLLHLLAEDVATKEVIGTVTGVDHVDAFDEDEEGSSLWALAVDPQTPHAGVGHALVAALLLHYAQLGREYLDLSVMHDNNQAISLYEKLGFERVPVFCLKRRNGFNEPLYTSHPEDEDLTSEGLAIVREARRLGITADVLDRETGQFSLSYGGRTVLCDDSLSELTSAIALSRCDDRRVTRRTLSQAGLRTPDQIAPRSLAEGQVFLAKHGSLLVKPPRVEPGRAPRVEIRSRDALTQELARAGGGVSPVVLEHAVRGHELSIVVIARRVVAAALKRPPSIVGNGEHSIRALIAKQSRRRAAASGGESKLPLDAETERCVREAGFELDDVLDSGTSIAVREAADLCTGGTLHDVTHELHPELAAVARRAAKVLGTPVVGLELVVPELGGPDYWILEATARPRLTSHAPQRTIERYLDFLFPQAAAPRAMAYAR